MRFLAVNVTGRTLHLRLDSSEGGKLMLTVSLNKRTSKRKPVGEYVLATNTPLHLTRLDNHDNVPVLNPDKLILVTGQNHARDFVMRVEGFYQ